MLDAALLAGSDIFETEAAALSRDFSVFAPAAALLSLPTALDC